MASSLPASHFEAGMSTEQQVLEEAQGEILLGRAIDAALDGTGMRELLGLVRRLGLEPDSIDKYKDNWRDDLKTLVDQIPSQQRHSACTFRLRTDECRRPAEPLSRPVAQDLDADLLQAIRSALPTIEAAAVSGGKKNTNTCSH